MRSSSSTTKIGLVIGFPLGPDHKIVPHKWICNVCGQELRQETFNPTDPSLFDGHLDNKPRSPGSIILHPYVTMMICNDGIDNSQTEAGS